MNEAIKCMVCKKILDRPVILPCGESICQSHVNKKTVENKQFSCVICESTHDIPANGFVPNRSLEKIMQTKIDKFDFGTEYQNASTICKRLAHILDEIELVRTDPCRYISECTHKLSNECNSKRDELKSIVDVEAEAIMNELIDFERECKENVKSEAFLGKSNEIGQKLKEKKSLLVKWLHDLSVLENDKWKRVNKYGEAVIADLEKNLVELKNNSMLDVKIEFEIPKSNEFIGILKVPSNGYNILLKRT
jgi:hypothetical protein